MMRKYIVFAVVFLIATQLYAYKNRDILSKHSSTVDLANVLIQDSTWNNLPDYYDRDFWNTIPENIAKQYISSAEAYLDYNWAPVKATDYLEFIRSGDRRQNVFYKSQSALITLVMGELVEGKGRFLDQIINGVWAYSEQTWWGWSAHMYMQKAPLGLPDKNDRTIDLGVGDISNMLSWTWYLFHHEFDKVHPLISERLKTEIYEKVLNPYYNRTDFWWMGIEDQSHINNWNPWINYNMLNCILLLESDPEKRVSGVQKVIRSLDAFLNSYPDDGGCQEGPVYWGAAGAQMWKSLDLLQKVTAGKFNVFDNELVEKIGTYIYKVYIHHPYLINFADADAKAGINPVSVYLYGKSIDDPVMQKFGAFLAKKSNWGKFPGGGMINESISNLKLRDELMNAEAAEPLVADFWLPDTEIAGARDREGSYNGFFFAAKGGFNNESHNHNDAGSCVLYYNGKPVLVDVGREKYTAKTFGEDRYSIWAMLSQYHNLPTINGINQKNGNEFKAKNTSFIVGKTKVVFSTDIAEAYPSEAEIKKWKRIYTLQKGKSFTIEDDYQLAKINDNETCLNFMTCCEVTIQKDGVLTLKGEDYELSMLYDKNQLEPVTEYIPVSDELLKNFWPDGLTRIVFRLKNQKISDTISIKIK
uniref:heparinase II/III domain-containing protein n=1 Tax=uncultured Draconibacterium sp. TaxID=1573823 RepID=UPI00321673A6